MYRVIIGVAILVYTGGRLIFATPEWWNVAGTVASAVLGIAILIMGLAAVRSDTGDERKKRSG